MVSSRSFVGMGRWYVFIPSTNQEEKAIAELERKGLVCRPSDYPQGPDDARWFLTARAASAMQMQLRLESPSLIFLGRKNIPVEEQTALELYEHLKGQGFVLVEPTEHAKLSKIKDKPYIQGAKGLAKSLVCLQRDYLLAMCESPKLFSKGCSAIHHFQLVAYYVALLRVEPKDLPKVVPGKAAAYYRSLWNADVKNPDEKSWLQLGSKPCVLFDILVCCLAASGFCFCFQLLPVLLRFLVLVGWFLHQRYN